jgi:PII-like signaling protein
MKLKPCKMLLIYLDESDRADEMPLYEAIVRRLAHLDVHGATVHAGIMGFGRRHRIHGKRLLGVSDDRPITVSVVDSEENVLAIVPHLQAMVPEGLIVLLDSHVVE